MSEINVSHKSQTNLSICELTHTSRKYITTIRLPFLNTLKINTIKIYNYILQLMWMRFDILEFLHCLLASQWMGVNFVYFFFELYILIKLHQKCLQCVHTTILFLSVNGYLFVRRLDICNILSWVFICTKFW